MKAEEKRLAERRKSMENSITRMKESVQQSMIATNKTRIKGDLFTFSIRNNPAKLQVLDDSAIPKSYFVEQEPKLDNKSLKQALVDGEEIDGAMLTYGKSLNIK